MSGLAGKSVALTVRGKLAVSSIIERSLSIACPTCGAEAHEDCEVGGEHDSELLSDVHRERVKGSSRP